MPIDPVYGESFRSTGIERQTAYSRVSDQSPRIDVESIPQVACTDPEQAMSILSYYNQCITDIDRLRHDIPVSPSLLSAISSRNTSPSSTEETSISGIQGGTRGISPQNEGAEEIETIEKTKTAKLHDEAGVKAADALIHQFKSGRLSFNGDMQDQKYNDEYWKKVPDPRNPNRHMWAPKDKLSEAVRDSMEGSDFDTGKDNDRLSKYSVDCAAATHLAKMYQELETIGDKAFNEKYKNLKINGDNGFEKIFGDPEIYRFGPGDKTKNLAGDSIIVNDSTIEKPDDDDAQITYVDASKIKDLDQILKPGMVAHFRNSNRNGDPPVEFTAWQGENAIYKGKDNEGSHVFACNPGGEKKAYLYTTPDGNKVWAMDVLGTDAEGKKALPFIMMPDIAFNEPEELNQRRLGRLN